MDKVCSDHREVRNAYKILIGKPEHSKDLAVDGKTISKRILGKMDRVWTALTRLIIQASGELLLIRQRIFKFRKRRKI